MVLNKTFETVIEVHINEGRDLLVQSAPEACQGCNLAAFVARKVAELATEKCVSVEYLEPHYSVVMSDCANGLEIKGGITCSHSRQVCGHPEADSSTLFDKIKNMVFDASPGLVKEENRE